MAERKTEKTADELKDDVKKSKPNQIQISEKIVEEFRIETNNINHYKYIFTNSKKVYSYSDGIWKELTEEDIVKLQNEIIKSGINLGSAGTLSQKEQLYKLISRHPKLFIDSNRLNANSDLICFSDCVLDISKNCPREHSPNDYLTNKFAFGYRNSINMPNFELFLTQISCGRQEIINLIKKMTGCCLTTSAKSQMAFILYGEGSNGKSTLLDLISQIVGESNSTALDLKRINDPKCIAKLLNKKIAICSELPNTKMIEDNLKSIISGDSIEGKFLYSDEFSFKPYTKLLISANLRMISGDTSHGFWRRFCWIPFDAKFDSTNMDKDILDKLIPEIPSIVNWAIEGLNELSDNGWIFPESDISNKLKEQMKEETSSVLAWLHENFEITEDYHRYSMNDIYENYSNWCNINGLSRKSSGTFGKDIRKITEFGFDVLDSPRRHDRGIEINAECFRPELNKNGVKYWLSGDSDDSDANR